MKYYEILIDGAPSGYRPKSLKKIQRDYEDTVKRWKGHKVEIVEALPFLDEHLVKNRIRNKSLTIIDKDGNEKRYSKIHFKTELYGVGWYFEVSGRLYQPKTILIYEDALKDLIWKKSAYDEIAGMTYKLD